MSVFLTYVALVVLMLSFIGFLVMLRELYFIAKDGSMTVTCMLGVLAASLPLINILACSFIIAQALMRMSHAKREEAARRIREM